MGRVKNIPLAFLLGITLNAPAFAEDIVDPILVEFETGCLIAVQGDDVSVEADEFRGWWSVNSDVNGSLDRYFGTISGLLGDKITRSAHFTKRLNNKQIYLTRYSYSGSFGMKSEVCMVSDFSRDDWTLPSGFDVFAEDKTIETAFSTVQIEGRKTVGQWRTTERAEPVSKITASAFAKDSADHEASGFYGLQLTSVKTDIQETEDNLN